MRAADLERLAQRGVSAGLIVAPWLALVWSPPTMLASLFGALVIAGAVVHGFGGTLAIVLDHSAGASFLFAPAAARRRPAVDTLMLGVAVVLLLGCTLAAFDHFDRTAQLATLIAGLVLHTFTIAHHHRDADLVARARAAVAATDAIGMLLWVVVLGVLVLHALGLFASQNDPVYDDDGHWFAAVKRLRDTGGFGDPLGYGRAYQLGGSVISSVFSATVGDVRCTRVGEALGFVLTVANLAKLALSRTDRHRAGVLIFLLLVLAVSGKAQGELDPSLFWLPCALFIATFRHLLERRRVGELRRADDVWLVLLVAAICAIRLEYVPFAAALAIGMPGTRLRDRAISMATLGGGILVCLAPILIDWYRAGDVDGTHPAARFGPLVATAVVVALGLVVPRRPRTPISVFTYAVAVTALIIFVIPDPAGEFSLRLVWVPIFALLYVAIAALAQTQWAAREDLADLRYGVGSRMRFRFITASMLVLAVVAFIMRAQDPTVHLSWRLRFRTWIEQAAELAVSSPARSERDPYAELLRRAPRGATVLAWVDHPERIDYRLHDIRDLRIPRHRDVRTLTWFLKSPVPRLIRTTGARYLLIEGDLLDHQRARDSSLFAFWCTAKNPDADPILGRPAICADALEQAIVGHRVLGKLDGVVLVDLTHDRR